MFSSLIVNGRQHPVQKQYPSGSKRVVFLCFFPTPTLPLTLTLVIRAVENGPRVGNSFVCGSPSQALGRCLYAGRLLEVLK